MPLRPVILDTNFLLVPFQQKLDIFSELEYLLDFSHQLLVCSKTISELKKLEKNKGKKGMAARLAIKLLEVNSERIDKVSSRLPVDEWIVRYAKKTGAIVCTNDRKLRNRLKARNIKVIALKGKSKVGFV